MEPWVGLKCVIVTFNSFLAHLSHRLMVSYCDVACVSCDVRRQQLLQRTSPNPQAGFLPNSAEMILIWPSLIIVQMIWSVAYLGHIG